MRDMILIGCVAAVFVFGYFIMGRLDNLLDGMAQSSKEIGTDKDGGKSAFGLPDPVAGYPLAGGWTVTPKWMQKAAGGVGSR